MATIIYGLRRIYAYKEVMPLTCPACSGTNCIEVHVVRQTFALFWIPMFPIGKTPSAYCRNCQKKFYFGNMPDEFMSAYKSIKSKAKVPLIAWMGTIVIIGLVAWHEISARSDNSRNTALLHSPQPGDVYTLRTSNWRYLFMKIDRVSNDSVFVLETKTVGAESALDDLKRQGDLAYQSHTRFSKHFFDTLDRKIKILEISRQH